MLIVIDESTLEENWSQPIPISFKQLEIAITILTGYNGNFKVARRNDKLSFQSLYDGDDCKEIGIPSRFYGIESSNFENKRNIIEKEYATGEIQQFSFEPKLSNYVAI